MSRMYVCYILNLGRSRKLSKNLLEKALRSSEMIRLDWNIGTSLPMRKESFTEFQQDSYLGDIVRIDGTPVEKMHYTFDQFLTLSESALRFMACDVDEQNADWVDGEYDEISAVTVIDYALLIDKLKEAGVVSVSKTDTILHTDPRSFKIMDHYGISELEDWVGKTIDVDCLGTKLCSQLTRSMEDLYRLKVINPVN